MRKVEKKVIKVSSKDRIGILPPTPTRDDSSKVTFLMNKIKNLQIEIEDLNQKLDESIREREVVDD